MRIKLTNTNTENWNLHSFSDGLYQHTNPNKTHTDTTAHYLYEYWRCSRPILETFLWKTLLTYNPDNEIADVYNLEL